ncbi:unnamed protein product [Soboliphyme baturini]|uniref:Coatomer subunit zeta n=1 Tax=Soboliphyme baturini TaxID=241478 RepID=A0A183I970_9BILA|nr:unnamed protein product [Soboliphyme baturini]
MYLSVAFWMSGNLNDSKTELKTALDLVISSRHFDYPASGIRRTVFTLAETLCILCLCLVASVTDVDEALSVLVKLSWIHQYLVHLCPENDLPHAESLLSASKLHSGQPEANRLIFVQVDEILFIFSVMKGSSDMRVIRMVDFDIHSVASSLKPSYCGTK